MYAAGLRDPDGAVAIRATYLPLEQTVCSSSSEPISPLYLGVWETLVLRRTGVILEKLNLKHYIGRLTSAVSLDDSGVMVSWEETSTIRKCETSLPLGDT